MPDNELRIGVSTDGKSINEVRALAKYWEDFAKSVTYGSKSFQIASQEAVRLKNATSQMSQALQTENAKMMKSYFSLGQQLRQFYMEQRVGDRTMREMASTAALFGVNMGGVVQITQQAEFAIHGLGMAAERAGGKLGAAGSQVLRFAGPLTALATIAGAEIMMFDDMVTRIAAAQNKMKGIKTPPKGDWYYRLLGLLQGPMAAGGFIGQLAGAGARATLAEERALWNQENMIQMEEITVTGGGGRAGGAASPFRAGGGGGGGGNIPGMVDSRFMREGFYPRRRLGGVAGGEGIEGATGALSFGESLGVEALGEGMASVANTTRGLMKSALMDAFGQSTNFFHMLLTNVISDVASQIGSRLITRGIGSLVGGLFPGLGGILSSLGMEGFGSTSSVRNAGVSAAIANSNSAGAWRIKGTDLVYVTQRTQNRLAVRAM